MIRKITSVFLVVVWSMLIFSFSNQDGSSSKKESDTLIDGISAILKIKEENREKMTFPIRKFAHFFVYFVLGFLIFNMLHTFNLKSSSIFYISIVVCILFAGSDELHQYFIQDRSAKISDALLDSSAALIGIYTYYILTRRKYENK